MSTIDWKAANQGIAKPFDVKDVDFRVAGKAFDGLTPVVAYVNRAALIRRLNDLFGAENWDFRFEVVAMGDTDVAGKNNTTTQKPILQIVKGFLTIGGITKEDIGDAADTEQTKSAVTDAFKRCCFLWGFGVDLAEMVGLKAVVPPYAPVPAGEVDRLRRQIATGVVETPPASTYRPPQQPQGEAPATVDVPSGFTPCPGGCGDQVKAFKSKDKVDGAGNPKLYYRGVDGGFHSCPTGWRP